MKEITEKYYDAIDGKRFINKSDCAQYENTLKQLDELKSQRDKINIEIAKSEYILYSKGKYIENAKFAGGCGHDGYYHKYPHCGELTGGYEGEKYLFKC